MNIGLVYDDVMTLHESKGHPESPERIRSIMAAIKSAAIPCLKIIEAKMASREELELAHDRNYINTIATAYAKPNGHASLATEYGSDVYFNESTYDCARIAAGSTLNLANAILSGSINSGFAVVRPPGHHASQNNASGFCIFNNVAISAIHCRNKGNRVLIVDWDIHHGDGTEAIVKGEKNIMFYSVQKYDNGKYYPGTGGSKNDSNIIDVGLSQVKGTDVKYYEIFIDALSQFKAFNPDIIIVSSGFDAVQGDPLGGFNLSPECYGYLTKLLKSVCPRVMLVLEGGYNCKQIGKCTVECMQALL